MTEGTAKAESAESAESVGSAESVASVAAALPTELWARVHDDLQGGLSSQQRAVLPMLTPVAVVDDTVLLRAPNAFTRNEADRLLRGPLAHVLGNRLGRTVRVVIVDNDVMDVMQPGVERSDDTPPPRLPHDHTQGRAGQLDREQPDHGGDSSHPVHASQPTVGADLPDPRERSEPGVGPARSTTSPAAAPDENGPAGPAGTARSGLNTRYTFDTFVTGASNRFAHAAAFAVAEGPAKAYNPLFIHGDSGLGKTHLLHAVGEYAARLFPGIRVRYVSTEEFTNDFINSVRDGTADGFRRRYRDVDVLLIDDIQFIENKEGTQEEFFHTFNTLHTNGKQLVITSDRPPKQLSTLEDRLRTRFEWGLITDITPPDLETRIAILRKKAEQERIDASDDVLEVIASRVQSNIRELEGALIRVAAFANLDRRPIDLEVAEAVLGDIVPGEESPQITVERIIAMTSEQFGVTVEDLCGSSRNRNLTQARQIAMYLCREMTDLSLPRIGQAFGNRDHTTVMHADRKIREQIQQKRPIYDQVTRLTKKIQGRDW